MLILDNKNTGLKGDVPDIAEDPVLLTEEISL